MNEKRLNQNHPLLMLAERWGAAEDIAAMKSVLEYAADMPENNGFMHALTAFGMFSRLQMKLPEKLRAELERFELNHRKDRAAELSTLSKVIQNLPQKSEEQVTEFLEAPGTRRLIRTGISEAISEHSNALAEQKKSLKWLDDAVKASTRGLESEIRHLQNIQQMNEDLCSKIKPWLILAALAVLLACGAQMWNAYQVFNGPATEQIATGFAKLHLNTHIEQDKDGTFVTLELDRSEQDREVRVIQKLPTSIIIGFLRSDAYPPER